jgi:phosphoribosyl-ATP pyrophosphohydrolase/phosphoribosyl-AMP cyclohydrolase
MNKEAFAYTLKSHRVWYYNLETKEVEKFGEETGEVQKLVSIKADNNYESLLIYVEQIGFVLRKEKGYKTCYIHEIYSRTRRGVSKHRKFGKVEVDDNFDYSKEDYEDNYE